MLLFSTVLDVLNTLTPDQFIQLVFEWNENSTHDANRVKDVRWSGEHTIRYGTPDLWLEFVEHPERSVLAVRHEKITEDGVVWDSDFILDYEKNQISIQLDRTYSEEALSIDAAFSTPHFITLLIEHGYLKDDQDLPVLRTPVYVSDSDSALISKVCSNTGGYKLPVVYVSKTAENGDPLSVSWLASRLKGAAHVLVEASTADCSELRSVIGMAEEPFGSVRIFYPSGSTVNKRILYRSATGDQALRLEKVIRNVIQYSISQRLDRHLTWHGINSTLLTDQLDHQISSRITAEKARKEAEEEVAQVYDVLDEELRSLQEKVAELTKANEALQYENQGLRAKYASSENVPLLYLGEEEDYYQGEIRDMILSVLDDALTSAEKMTRKADVLEDILDNNPYYRLSEERKQRVKKLFSGYKAMTSAMKQELQSMGFELTEGGKHYKITYRSDSRYTVTAPKTPSDVRSGINCALQLNRKML